MNSIISSSERQLLGSKIWELPLPLVKLLFLLAVMYAKSPTDTMVRTFYDIRRHIPFYDGDDKQLYKELRDLSDALMRYTVSDTDGALIDGFPSEENSRLVVQLDYFGCIELTLIQWKELIADSFDRYTDADIEYIYKLEHKSSIALFFFLRSRDDEATVEMSIDDMVMIMGCTGKILREDLSRRFVSPAMIELLDIGVFEKLSGSTRINKVGELTTMYTIIYKRVVSDAENVDIERHEHNKEHKTPAVNNMAGAFGRYKQSSIDFDYLSHRVFLNTI